MAGPSLEGLINPRMLQWAREQCRMDVALAARRVNKSASQLEKWEQGHAFPTLNQVRSLAKIYKRSVGVFFLREEPPPDPRPVDYRRFELSKPQVMSTELANTIREAEAKRLAALDIFIQAEDEAPIFDAFLNPQLDPESAAEFLGGRLGITMQLRQKWSDDYQALAAWKSRVEALGVLVMQSSGVNVKEMRGCSLAFFPLPVIILNAADTPLGRIFSLVHELTHLASQQSALCDEIEGAPRDEPRQRVEVFCNHVAGAVLIPRGPLFEQPEIARAEGRVTWTDEQLRRFRRIFWASREAILRRLLIFGRTSKQHYRDMCKQFEDEYERAASKPKRPIIVPISTRVLLNNGRLLTRLVVGAYDASVISGPELSRILGTKIDHLPQINEGLREREVA